MQKFTPKVPGRFAIASLVGLHLRGCFCPDLLLPNLSHSSLPCYVLPQPRNQLSIIIIFFPSSILLLLLKLNRPIVHHLHRRDCLPFRTSTRYFLKPAKTSQPPIERSSFSPTSSSIAPALSLARFPPQRQRSFPLLARVPVSLCKDYNNANASLITLTTTSIGIDLFSLSLVTLDILLFSFLGSSLGIEHQFCYCDSATSALLSAGCCLALFSPVSLARGDPRCPTLAHTQ